MSLSDFQNSYQYGPIVLVGGIAGAGMLPLPSIISSQNYPGGVTSAADSTDPNAIQTVFGQGSSNSLNNITAAGTPAAFVAIPFFGQFRVLPGNTLMKNEVATYPVANQTTAANAVITEPLTVSLEMIAPANGSIPFSTKTAIMNSLKKSLDKHTAQGGWYNVATPSYVYQGCLLTDLVDASDDGEGSQPQVRWVWNFMQPLLTAAAAQAAQNQFMAKISAQTQNSGSPPGSNAVQTGVGNPSSNITQNIIPASSGSVAASVAPRSSSAVSSWDSNSPLPAGF